MALGLIGLLDLSIVTDQMIALLKNYRDNSAIWPTPGSPSFDIDVTGSAPDSVRSGSSCVLSLYLFHVGVNKQQRNSPVLPGHRVPPVPFQPLPLDLYYLLTAWADKNYLQEQKAMSIALKCFHENPIVRRTVTLGPDTVPEEFTLTMEMESADEIGRLWQAVSSPARLAAVYKVSVAFITPERAAPPAPPTRALGLAVGAAGDLAAAPTLFGTSRGITFRAPQATGTPPTDLRAFDLSPAVAGPNEELVLFGHGLDTPDVNKTFLIDGAAETDISSWNVVAEQTPARRVLHVPAAGAPAAGVYQLRVGNGTLRSNATPFSLGARIDPPAPGAPPILTAAGGVFTVAGAGFVPGQTEVWVGGERLTKTGGAPAAGEFSVTLASLQFRPPALAAGTYPVRVRVNGIESSPAWWVTLP